MGALENAKTLTGEEILKKISDLGLTDQGLYKTPIADLVAAAKAEAAKAGVEAGVACGLNNADIDYALLGLVEKQTDKVLSGIAILALAMGADKKILYVPAAKAETADKIKDLAAGYGVEVEASLINKRINKTNALIHVAAACDIADAFEDKYEEGVYVSVDGNVKKVPADTRVADLVDLTDAKAVIAGYRLYKLEEAITADKVTNGNITVITNKECLVDTVAKRMSRDRKQSCGKCVFCREGLIQFEYMQNEIVAGRGKMDHFDLTEEIGDAMTFSSLCSMGLESAKLALDAMDKFADEYTDHIKRRKCPAGTCKAFINMYVDPDKCIGCNKCAEVCDVDGMEGLPGYIYTVDEFNCTKCDKCIAACPTQAIVKTMGRVPKLPDRLTRVGKFLMRY